MTYAEGGFNPAKDGRRFRIDTRVAPEWVAYFSGRAAIDWAERNRATAEEAYRRLRDGGDDG
ncbi:hypothetical protein SAMN05443544_0577 [Agromyces cerinus subsp. cerinus]|uniref:Uncharacterized protein n=1 Tax=Agromyces cerinus subsp. cerinus TaxID=232089 RepID=A0A1N6DPU5_9MICO|nr:hypothetical protein SAMN05443544_0577 [Agromyces cerinus subsp. cerinus]